MVIIMFFKLCQNCYGFISHDINALVNMNSQGHQAPSTGNPEDSDRVYLIHTGESDSLILTHSGDI